MSQTQDEKQFLYVVQVFNYGTGHGSTSAVICVTTDLVKAVDLAMHPVDYEHKLGRDGAVSVSLKEVDRVYHRKEFSFYDTPPSDYPYVLYRTRSIESGWEVEWCRMDQKKLYVDAKSTQ